MAHGDGTLHGGTGQGLASPSEVDVSGQHEEEHHPGSAEYIRIAIILTIITAAEVAIYYVEGIRDFLVPLLVILSVAKFVAVVGYFMHLKFDDRRFLLMFAAGLGISLAVITALVVMFWTSTYFSGVPIGG